MLRLLPLDGALLDGDAFHVWDRARAVLDGGPLPWRGEGEGFHYGAAQVVLALPLLALASGLRGAVTGVAVLHALGAIPLGLAGRRTGGAPLGLLAAALYATWPMLAAHPAAGSHTYLAPPLVALAAWSATATLAGARAWAAALTGLALALAVAMHPYALAPAVGSLALLPWIVRRRGWRVAAWGAISFAIAAAPMVVDNALLRFGEPERAATYALVGDGGLRDWWTTGPLEACWGWPRPLALIALATPPAALAALVFLPGVRRAPGPGPALAVWSLASLALLLGGGLALRYLRPYHLGAVAPLLTLGPVWALTAAGAQLARGRPRLRIGGWCLTAAALLLALPATIAAVRPPAAMGQLHLATIERVADAIRLDADGAEVALALLADTGVAAHGQIGAYETQLVMGGTPVAGGVDAPAHARRLASAYLIVELSPAVWAAWGIHGDVLLEQGGEGGVLRVLGFRDAATAERWLALGCPLLADHPGLRLSRLRHSLGGMPGAGADPAAREARGELPTFCDAVTR